jgi:inner membrane transporter RhtA
MTLIQLGAALSAPMLREAGAFYVTWLRLCWAAALMLSFVRPAGLLRAMLRGQAWSVVALGVASGAMTMCYFSAVARIPLGMANGIEFLGPLGVAVLGSRRWRDLLWTALAGCGVFLLLQPGKSWQPDGPGVAFALAAAGGWAAYILLTQRVGARFAGLEGVAASLTIAALVATPAGLTQAWGRVSARDALAAGGIAILIPVLPYVLELSALRRMSTASFGILMSLEPAIAATMGVLLLGQHPGLFQMAGFVCVTGASIGTVSSTQRS